MTKHFARRHRTKAAMEGGRCEPESRAAALSSYRRVNVIRRMSVKAPATLSWYFTDAFSTAKKVRLLLLKLVLKNNS